MRAAFLPVMLLAARVGAFNQIAAYSRKTSSLYVASRTAAPSMLEIPEFAQLFAKWKDQKPGQFDLAKVQEEATLALDSLMAKDSLAKVQEEAKAALDKVIAPWRVNP